MKVVGLGQPAAGDDGVGLAVLNALGDVDAELVPLRDASPLVELLDGTPLLLVDALVGAGEPGSLRWLTAADLGRASLWSTHGLSVPDAIGLAQAIHGPDAADGLEVLAICIEAPTGPCFELSPTVAAAVPQAAEAVRQRLRGT